MSRGNHFCNFITLDVNHPPKSSGHKKCEIDFTLINNLPVPISVWQKVEDNYYLIYLNQNADKVLDGEIHWGIRLNEAFPIEYQNILSTIPSEDSFFRKIDDDLLIVCHYFDNHTLKRQNFPGNILSELDSIRKIIEPSPVSVLITDDKGNIEYVNPKFVEVSGYSEEEVLGKNPRILKSGNKSPQDYKKMWETIMAGQVWRGEFSNKRKNGELYYEYTVISPIKDYNGKIKNFIAFKEDITRLKNAENERQKSEKFAELGKMAAFVSHQIKTPLSSIKLSIDLLEQNDSFDQEAKKSISIIQKEVKHLSVLLKEVLQFSNSSKMHFTQINLAKKMDSIHTLLNPMLNQNKIKFETRTSGHYVYGDTQQLQSLFLHLLENSIESIDKDGEIEIYSEMKDDKCHIFVKDNGSGIDNTRDIFEPFFTTKSSGAGFGLPIAKNIAEKHSGQLKLVSSRPGETIFELILPAIGETIGKTPDN